jgi:hypothetical protein
VVEKLITPHGFAMRFAQGYDFGGNPAHRLMIYRVDDGLRIKSLYLQAPGNALDPGLNNVQGLNLARDTSQLVNKVIIGTDPTKYEVSVVLAPGFEIAGTDADADNLKKWQKGDAGDTYPPNYRVFVAAEDGTPHWKFGLLALVDDVTSLADIFGDPRLSEAKQEMQYVTRPRPGDMTCFSLDEEGKPRQAELWISTVFDSAKYDAVQDADLPYPGVWSKADGEDWQRVNEGGWRLLKDRLGIELTMADPASWSIGESTTPDAPFPSGKVNVVESMANPTRPGEANPRFWFRLTTVIESDEAMDATAGRRFASPTAYEVAKYIDAKDKFQKWVIDGSSHFNPKPVATVARDDTLAAQSYAAAIRRANETGVFGGSVTIPRISLDYLPGDKVDVIRGRGIDLTCDAGWEAGEERRYPTVVGLTWHFEGGQATELSLSDHRADPAAGG